MHKVAIFQLARQPRCHLLIISNFLRLPHLFVCCQNAKFNFIFDFAAIFLLLIVACHKRLFAKDNKFEVASKCLRPKLGIICMKYKTGMSFFLQKIYLGPFRKSSYYIFLFFLVPNGLKWKATTSKCLKQ